MSKKIIALLLTLAMVLSLAACSSSSSSTTDGDTTSGTDDSGSSTSALTWKSADEFEDDAAAGETDDRAFMKFPETVTVHFAGTQSATDTTLPEGDSLGNNQYTRYLEETFNIGWEADWTVGSTSDFNQKVSLAIASADLPDALVFSDRNYMVKAAEAGLLADMHDVFDDYSSKQVKEIMDTTGGRAYENCTYDGVFCALPNVTVDTDGVYIYFIRQDWLDQLGIEVPKTVDELFAAGKAFMDAGLSPKYGVAAVGQNSRTYSNFLNSSNLSYGFDAVYSAMGAFPGYFLKDESGEIYYGTNTSEMRDALEKLAGYYADGIINPEMGTTDNAGAEIADGTCGIFMGPWWDLGYGNGDSYKNDPTADWQAYPLYTDDGKWVVKMKDVGTTYTGVSADASEDVKKAIVIANNVLVRDESIMDTSVAIGNWPLRNVIAAADECEYEYEAIYKVLRGEATAEDYNVPGSLYKNLYTDLLSLSTVISEDYDPDEQLHVTDMDVFTDNGQFNRLTAILIGDRPYATEEPDEKVYSEIYYTIDGFDKYWTNLSDMEDQVIMSIITGKSDISAFDTFVEDWNSQGGETLLGLVKDFVD